MASFRVSPAEKQPRCEGVASGLHAYGMEIKRTPEFREWLDGLRDVAGRARIQARIERLAAGNPGDHRNLEGGISEMRVDVGPGYRVYYTRRATC
jgi:putative addiction module killer protein